MALTPSFTLANNSGVSQNTFALTDNSTGTDGAITKLQVTVYDDANNQIPGSPVTFNYTLNASYNVSILTQDIAVNVRVDWLNNANVSLYNTSQIFDFTGFLEWFIYGLLQQVAANNALLNDRNFFFNWGKIITLVDSANKAITTGASIFNSEAMILLAQQMLQNSNLYF